jgi:hypothetical protein
MKKFLAILLLLPCLSWAESLVYLKKQPTVVNTPMQGPTAILDVEGPIDQPICIAVVDGEPIYAALVKDEKVIEKNAAYLGKGLNEVQAKDKKLYEALTYPEVDQDGNETGKRYPKQTFSGYDALTGVAK